MAEIVAGRAGEVGEVAPRTIAGLFLLSGFCGIGIEVVWAHQLRLVLGSTTAGVSFGVAVYMLGLAAGYLVGVRLLRRIRRNVAAYGLIELSMAATGLASVHLLPKLQVLGGGPIVWLFAALLLLPFATLAGTTLPLLVQAARGSTGTATGRLYGLNTAGAVFGVLFTGLVFVGQYGLWGTALILAALQATLGALAMHAGRRDRRMPAATTDDQSGQKLDQGAWCWLAVALLAGTASLSEEVLWTRALTTYLNSTTYSFSLILAVFLTGLALGAGLAGRIARRWDRPVLVLGFSQLAAGALVLLTPELFGLAHGMISGYAGAAKSTGYLLWLGTLGVSVARVALVLLPPSILLGLALPLTAHLLSGGEGQRGRAAGLVSGANTVGAVIGALGAHFLLLPLLGVSGGLQAAVVLHVLIAGLLVFKIDRKLVLLVPAVLLLILAVGRPSARPYLGRLAERHRVILVDEGVQDTTVVVELTSGSARGAYQIFSNGIAYAGDLPYAKRYMRLLGHLPALLSRRRERALVVCLGTGMTASAVARHSSFKRIDLVDISPAVYKTLPLFSRSNDKVHLDPRARIHIVDGRIFMARAKPESYDVITLEPPPPRAAGVAALYSVEFYRAARRMLADGGALAQWLPIHGMTDSELAMLTRTFLRAFPEGRFYLLHPLEAALIGIKGRGASRREALARIREPKVADHLRSIKVPDPLKLLRRRGAGLRKGIGPGPVVTDDHPRIEYFAARLPWWSGSAMSHRFQFMKRILLGRKLTTAERKAGIQLRKKKDAENAARRGRAQEAAARMRRWGMGTQRKVEGRRKKERERGDAGAR